MSSLLVLCLALAVPAPQDVVETETFRLYKFQQAIGAERSVRERRPDGSVEIRTSFAFRDRWTTVPLSSVLRLAKDGTPVFFQLWGSTSRGTSADERVSIEGGAARIERDGAGSNAAAPRVFFTADGYAPVAVTEELWRYWQSHGRPAEIPLLPSGRASIERRGVDDVTDDAGKPVRLERFAVSGLEWGRETLWVDADGRLAALKAVDAEFDHFEATRDGYSDALPRLIASAAADGMAALKELCAPLLSVPEAGEGKAVAYVGATLVDGRGGPPVPDAAVVVLDGKIAAAGPRRDVRIPSGARRVELAGKFLLPGLWDMHAHFEQVEWGPLYLAAGVTTVRDCGNEMDFIRSVRDTIEAGKGLGPTILLACFVDGESPGSIGTTRLRDESEIPAIIARFRDARCSQVKIYQSVPPKLIAPLAKAAHEAGLTVTGHVPTGIGAVHAVEAGMDQINHIGFIVRALAPDSYDPDASLSGSVRTKAMKEMDLASPSSRRTLELFKSRHVVVDPTMALADLGTHSREENARREPGLAKVAEPLREPLASMGSPAGSESAALVWKADLDVLRALHASGIPIVAGTDQAVPGHSLHREMEIYVEAGFTPMEAIQSATIVPARAMGREKDSGTIEAGKRADLIVVDGDPLADIRNLRRVVTVVQAGRAYDAAKLWRLVDFTP
jgi:imidazolonepropionase-like amidohydrolase